MAAAARGVAVAAGASAESHAAVAPGAWVRGEWARLSQRAWRSWKCRPCGGVQAKGVAGDVVVPGAAHLATSSRERRPGGGAAGATTRLCRTSDDAFVPRQWVRPREGAQSRVANKPRLSRHQRPRQAGPNRFPSSRDFGPKPAFARLSRLAIASHGRPEATAAALRLPRPLANELGASDSALGRHPDERPDWIRCPDAAWPEHRRQLRVRRSVVTCRAARGRRSARQPPPPPTPPTPPTPPPPPPPRGAAASRRTFAAAPRGRPDAAPPRPPPHTQPPAPTAPSPHLPRFSRSARLAWFHALPTQTAARRTSSNRRSRFSATAAATASFTRCAQSGVRTAHHRHRHRHRHPPPRRLPRAAPSSLPPTHVRFLGSPSQWSSSRPDETRPWRVAA